MRRLITHILPFDCVLCHHPLSENSQQDGELKLWCDTCSDSIQPSVHCPRCGLLAEQDDLACGACLSSPPLWDALYCVGDYVAPFDRVLHQFKYKGQFWLASSLASLVAPKINQTQRVFVPVPMHWTRRLYRGFNHSHVLANALAKQLNGRTLQAIARKRSTLRQQGLSRKQRLTNLHNAFEVVSPLPDHITLVDDIVTTGSTINAMCELLKKHQVKTIDVICICRTSS